MHDPVKDKQPVKGKRNAEKRKAKSRDAARCRRGKEADVFSELSSLIPVSAETVASMDKASLMRLAISHLKLRTLMGEVEEGLEDDNQLELDCQYEQALNGFLVVMDKEGEFVYVSENVVTHIGLNQLDLLGQTILEYSHPCDHDEIEEFLSEKHVSTDRDVADDETTATATAKTFFARIKCTLTNKGKNVNLKSATYKVIRFRGHRLVNKGLDCWLLIGESIPHPAHVDEPFDNSAIITRHTLDMKFSNCDERMEEELGFSCDELENKSLFEFHHALDGEYMDKIYKDLYSKGQVWTDHYRFLVKHGGFKWMETQATIVHNQKTDKPQYIICVHHVLSGVEEEGRILSTVQEPGKGTCLSKTNNSLPGIPKPTLPKTSEGPIFTSTESIFVPRTKEMDRGVCAPKRKLKEEIDSEMGQIAPTAGDEIIPLFHDQERDMVSLLQDVLLQASEMDDKNLSTFPLSMQEEEEPASISGDKQTFETPNLEQLVDELPRSTPHFGRQTKLLEAEEVDLDMRAPFIPMPGEDSMLFQMAQPVPLTDDMEDSGPMQMLGTTESVFNARPEDSSETNKKMPIPISILRQEAMQKKEKQYKEMEHKKVTLKLRHPVETNRLETGPPSKRARLVGEGARQDPPCSPISRESVVTTQTDIKGSSVLKNLLLTGHDDSNGYDVMKYNTKTQKASALPGPSLRGLLTGPLTFTPPATPSTSAAQSPASSSVASPIPSPDDLDARSSQVTKGLGMAGMLRGEEHQQQAEVMSSQQAATIGSEEESPLDLSDEMLLLLYNLYQNKITVQ